MKKFLMGVVFVGVLTAPMIVFLFIPSALIAETDIFTIIGYFVSTYTLIATVGIALGVYFLQKRDGNREERRKIAQAKSAMLLELENAFELFIFMKKEDRFSQSCSGIKDVFSTYSGDLRKGLSPEEFHRLTALVNGIYKGMQDEEYLVEMAGFLRPWIQKLYLSHYIEYFPCVFDYTELLNKPIFELIYKLKDEHKVYQSALNQIFDNDGRVVFEHKGNIFCVYSNGEKILDGKLDWDVFEDEIVIFEGYEKTNRYEGYYLDGKFHGRGVEYDREHQPLREGEWEDGELIKGIEYNWVVLKDERVQSYFQYGKDDYEKFFWLESVLSANGMDKFFVADRKVEGDRSEWQNFRTLESFLENRNPEKLQWLREVCMNEETDLFE